MPENKKTSFADYLSTFFLSRKDHEIRTAQFYKTVGSNMEAGERRKENHDNSLNLIIDRYLPSARGENFDHDDNAHKSWRIAMDKEKRERSSDRRTIKKYLLKHISTEDLIHGHIFPTYSKKRDNKDFGKIKWRIKHLILEPAAAFSFLVILSAILSLAYPATAENVVEQVDRILFFPLVQNEPAKNLTPPRAAAKEQLTNFITTNQHRLKKAFDRKQDNFLITQDDLLGRVAGAEEIAITTKLKKLSRDTAEEEPIEEVISYLDKIIENEKKAARFILRLLD